MTKDKFSSLFNQAFDIVCDHYGYSKHHDSHPHIEIEDSECYDSEVDPSLMGEYCSVNNVLTLYWKNIHTIENLIRTVVHEYQHYLQSPSWMTRYYNMGYNYNNHPYEIAAYSEEDNWKTFNKILTL